MPKGRYHVYFLQSTLYTIRKAYNVLGTTCTWLGTPEVLVTPIISERCMQRFVVRWVM
jgi:hypothetical protein